MDQREASSSWQEAVSCPVTELAMKTALVATLALSMSLASATTRADQGNARLGFRLAKQHCSSCHAILKTGTSPEKLAPPFRVLHKRYPIDNLVEALGEGIRTGHPVMPEFRLDPDQIMGLIAYLKSLGQ
jgi:cytochrome c